MSYMELFNYKYYLFALICVNILHIDCNCISHDNTIVSCNIRSKSKIYYTSFFHVRKYNYLFGAEFYLIHIYPRRIPECSDA